MLILEHEIDIGINLRNEYIHTAHKYAEAGFSVAELDLPKTFATMGDFSIYEDALKNYHPKIREAGLRCCSMHLPYGRDWDITNLDKVERENVIRNFKEVIEMTQGYEGDILVLHPSTEPIDISVRETKLQLCEENIERLVEAAKGIGKELVLEDLPRTCLGNTSLEIERLTKRGTRIGCCMDTTHLFQEHILDFWDRCGSYVRHTHLSDYLTGAGECHWCPGTGDIPWKKLFLRMFESDYSGVFLFELQRQPLEIINGLKNAIHAEK